MEEEVKSYELAFRQVDRGVDLRVDRGVDRRVDRGMNQRKEEKGNRRSDDQSEFESEKSDELTFFTNRTTLLSLPNEDLMMSDRISIKKPREELTVTSEWESHPYSKSSVNGLDGGMISTQAESNPTMNDNKNLKKKQNNKIEKKEKKRKGKTLKIAAVVIFSGIVFVVIISVLFTILLEKKTCDLPEQDQYLQRQISGRASGRAFGKPDVVIWEREMINGSFVLKRKEEKTRKEKEEERETYRLGDIRAPYCNRIQFNYNTDPASTGSKEDLGGVPGRVSGRLDANGIDFGQESKFSSLVWPTNRIVYTFHPSEASLWIRISHIFEKAAFHWSKGTCVSFERRDWSKVKDLTLTPKGSTNTKHNVENMVLVLSNYKCKLSSLKGTCSASVGTPCRGPNHKNEVCILSCESSVPWEMPYVHKSDGVLLRNDNLHGVKCLANVLTIGDECLHEGPQPSTLMHELGHVLGMYHEMMRLDRDEYVELLTGRLYKESAYDFKLLWPPTKVFNTMYDYLSLMHYGQYAFSKRPGVCVTIRTKNKCAQKVIGETEVPSFYDVMLVNTLYMCNFNCQNYTGLSDWVQSGFGRCFDHNRQRCYRLPDCTCSCPHRADNDVRYIPSTRRKLYELLPPACRKSCGYHSSWADTGGVWYSVAAAAAAAAAAANLMRIKFPLLS